MIDSKPALILLVAADAADAISLTRSLGLSHGCRVLRVPDLETATARIAGGGVDLVVAALPADASSAAAEWRDVSALHRRIPELAILVLLAEGQTANPLGHFGQDGRLCMLERTPGPDLAAAAQTAIEPRRSTPIEQPTQGAGCLIAFQGVKGGVGVTTTALNVAAELARYRKTILVEMSPGSGSLLSYFGLPRRVRMLPAKGMLTAADVKPCLWPCDPIPGLAVLFAPQSPQTHPQRTPEEVDRLLGILGELAECVVADLPHAFCVATGPALRAADCCVLVMERDSWCLQAASHLMSSLEAENLLPQAVGAAVVNRALLAAPVELAEVTSTLKVPVFGVLAPAPDLCLRAYKAHQPVTVLDPDSLLAQSCTALAQALPAKARPAPILTPPTLGAELVLTPRAPRR